MKFSSAIVWVGLITSLGISNVFGEEAKNQVGRYQIIQATYKNSVFGTFDPAGKDYKENTSMEQGLFKIDTVTGKTWIYLSQTLMVNGVGTRSWGWIELKADVMATEPPKK